MTAEMFTPATTCCIPHKGGECKELGDFRPWAELWCSVTNIPGGATLRPGGCSDVPECRGSFVPPSAPVTCSSHHGSCTGTKIWFWEPAPQRCVQAAGRERCCGGWNQYPWIQSCSDGRVTDGCGFCFW